MTSFQVLQDLHIKAGSWIEIRPGGLPSELYINGKDLSALCQNGSMMVRKRDF